MPEDHVGGSGSWKDVVVAHIDRRQALRLLAGIGVTGLAAACGSDPVDDDVEQVSEQPVRIGLIAPQTGALKVIGAELVNGFQLYLNDNQRRLGGHPVDLVIADEGDFLDGATAGVAAVDRLLQQGVAAIAGVANSALLLQVRDKVETAKVPLLAANGTPSALEGVKYIWSTSYVDDEPGQALGKLLEREVKGKVAIVAPKYPVGEDAVAGFREAFGSGDPRIADDVIWTAPSFDPPPGFYAEALRRVRQSGAAALYCYFAGPAGVAFIKELRAERLRIPIYASSLLTEENVLPLLAGDARGIFTASNYSVDLNNRVNRRFAQAYRKANNVNPSATAVAAYDAAQVLDKAVRIAGAQPTPQALNVAIAKVGQIDSPRGVWQFNQPRTPLQRWYLREVRPDGQVLGNVTLSELSTLG